MGPSCSNKPGNTTYLKETCSSFNSLCSIQISCDPATQLIQYNILSLNFQYCRHFALLCMMFVTSLCRQTFPTYFFFQHKCIAVILGFQRLIVIFQDKSFKTLTFFVFFFGSKIWNSVPQSIKYFLNINLKLLYNSSFSVF